MTYATASQFIQQYDAEEIAQRADRGIPRLVTAEMLELAAIDGDLSGFTVEEQAATVKALELINVKLEDADSVVNGYLASRYNLPLAVLPRMIVTTACDIARYEIYDDNATEIIATRYKDAIKRLTAISKGEINLGIDTSGNKPVINDGAQVVTGGKVFVRDGSFI